MISEEVIRYIKKSVLCWLATASKEGIPNVSPKEIFCWYQGCFLIANIASPGSATNIQENKNVAVSFIDILEQKGYQLKGTAQLVKISDFQFSELAIPLKEMAGDLYPFNFIIKIKINASKNIIAPSYIFNPDQTIDMKITNAKKQYLLE